MTKDYTIRMFIEYQHLMDTLCPGQIIKCDWLCLEWTKMKSISKIHFCCCWYLFCLVGWFVFVQSNSQEQRPSPQHMIFSFIVEFHFQVPVLSTSVRALQEGCCATSTAGLTCGHAPWRCSCRAGAAVPLSHFNPRQTRQGHVRYSHLRSWKPFTLTCWNKTGWFRT